jgi:ADP-ribose pyrophosphatase YjhB (NUDIX family)
LQQCSLSITGKKDPPPRKFHPRANWRDPYFPGLRSSSALYYPRGVWKEESKFSGEKMKTKLFCNYCHGSLVKGHREGKERQICENCGEIYYENPLPAVSVIVANANRELLLVRRAREPAKEMWCFPIGFAESGESIEDAAMRELKEEAGIDGKVLQIVDVFSESNDIYGEVLVVSFEAERVGGCEMAGDDAVDCAYFPLANLPKLAFLSQERALKKFIAFKKDTWNMTDSFQKLVHETLEGEVAVSDELLSDELVRIIEANVPRIIDWWLSDISTNPSTKRYRTFDRVELLSTAKAMISELEAWLKGKQGESELKTLSALLGWQRSGEMVPLEELISAISLLKKHIFRFTSSAGVWSRPVEMYRVLELGERLVYFFDRVTYYAVAGYGRTS